MIMKSLVILFSAALFALGSAQGAFAEMRCGWLENPTPGNWWLVDKDASWTLMEQGGYEADGMDMIGDISTGDYVKTNGNYGYACACLDVMTDAEQKRVTMIHGFKQLKMSKCTNDKALPAPDQ
jgi:hypothetical protein